uniref:Ras-GEF domain-containing protein n=1 Tax=Gongylonema pulchrum TaxID=637853 RepID=A0A183DBX5_9BILA
LSGREFGSEKTWIIAELGIDEDRSGKELQEFVVDSDLQIIYLRQQQHDLPQFKNYFLRVLKNNYQSYSLLSSLIQQMYNCTLSNGNNTDDCSKVDIQRMALSYKQTSTVESIIKAIYALTAVAANLQKKPHVLTKW